MRPIRLWCICLLVILSVSGCTENQPQVKEEDLTSSEIMVKVMLEGDDRWFQERYGSYFKKLYPKVTFEAIPLPAGWEASGDLEAWGQAVEEAKPDLLILPAKAYAVLSEQGRLFPVQTLTDHAPFPLETLHQPTLDYLTVKGGGTLYGLTPYLYSTALFYNKNLFEEAGIPYPSASMTWKQLVQTANSFPEIREETGARMFGLSMLNTYRADQFPLQIAGLNGISIFEAERTEEWVSSWKTLLDLGVQAVQSGAVYHAIYEKELEEPKTEAQAQMRKFNLFLTGESAMTIDHAMIAQWLKQADVPFEWDVVPIPASITDTEASHGTFPVEVFAVPEFSGHAYAAWELIRTIHGDSYGREALAQYGQLPTVNAIVESEADFNLRAFYAAAPADSMLERDLSLQQHDMMLARNLIQSELQKLAAGDYSLDQAVAVLKEAAP